MLQTGHRIYHTASNWRTEDSTSDAFELKAQEGVRPTHWLITGSLSCKGNLEAAREFWAEGSEMPEMSLGKGTARS